MTFHAKKGSLLIYTIYRPNKSTLKRAGCETVWMQQKRALTKLNNHNDPRTQFITDLIHDIKNTPGDHNHVIIAGDFNEDMEDNETGGIQHLMDECDLVNAFYMRYGTCPSTRGNDRAIDHVLVSPAIQHKITRAGVIPKEIGFSTSDHCALFVDFSPSILDTRNIPMQPASRRKLRIQNAPKVEWYIQQVLEKAKNQNILSRLKSLQTDIGIDGFTEEHQKTLENIDSTMTDIMLKVEDQISPDSVPYAFSEEVLEQMISVRVIKQMRNLKSKNNTQAIAEMVAYNPGADELNQMTVPELNALLKAERAELVQMQEDSYEYRERHMDTLYEKAAELHNKDKMTVVKETKEREKQSRMYQKLDSVLNSNRFQAIIRLGLPSGMMSSSTQSIWDFLQIKEKNNEKITWEYTEDETEISRRLREWNMIHFNQAVETPLATEQWEHSLDPNKVLENNMIQILDDAIHNDTSLHKDSRCFLEEMKTIVSKPMDHDQTHITVEKFQTFYRRTPEDRSSSPSGLHLGHYKAASFSKEFSTILCLIASIAFDNQYALTRWCNSATTLLEKSMGNPFIHKYRTIHLLESDLNYIMRVIWGKNFMQHNEIGKTFHNNQYGGRKGRQPTSAILNKVLTLDVIRYYGEDMIIVDNDVKACYDRIIPYVTLFLLRRLGMPVLLGRFMCNVLNNMKYTIRTGAGYTAPYSHKDTRLFGTEQGAGWSPPYWATNSDVISCVMERFTPGMLLEHPNQQQSSHRHIDAFVDDSSIGVTQSAYDAFSPHPDDPIQKGVDLYDQARLNTQFYSRLVFTTGGLLAIHKCLAYVLIFVWVQGIKRMTKVTDKYPPIKIQQGINQDYDWIRIKNPEEAFRMLGGYVAPDGNTTKQVEILYTIAKNWSIKVKRSHLNRHEAYVAYHQVLVPALTYALGAIPVSEEDCTYIMGPALAALLPKMNLPSTLARELVHGPIRFGGLEITNIYTAACTNRIKMFIGHLRKKDTTGDILQISLGCCQQEVGIGPNLLQQNFTKYGWILQHCWIRELWRSLHKVNGEIEIEDDWDQQYRLDDQYLMRIVHDLDLTPTQISQVNLCRLFKRITFLSEIMDHNLQGFMPYLWHPD